MNYRDLLSPFTTDMGIDLGTANTLVYVRGRGLVINEPSVVSINRGTQKVEAVGSDAELMLGRTPRSILAVEPLKDGVITRWLTLLRPRQRSASRHGNEPRPI